MENYSVTNKDTRISNQTKLSVVSSNKNNINPINNRIYILSPSVNKGLDRESMKTDFNREDNSSFDLGCYGKIWKVSHKRTARLYAIKVLHKERISKKNLNEEINRVLESMYKLNHINFLRILNHFEDEDNLYLMIQNLNNESLFESIKDLDETKVIEYVKQVIYALIYLHSNGVFNRDLKPESIFIDDYDKVRISDYGWSDIKSTAYESIRKNFHDKNSNCNSISFYSAPEEVENEKITNKIDLWSLGVLLYELLSRGDLPFKGESYEELKYNILNVKITWSSNITNESVKTLIRNMLKRNPEDRINLNDILKNIIFLQVQIPNYNPNEKVDLEENIINKRSTQKSISPQDQLIIKLKKENEILKKENENYKKRNYELEKENQEFKNKFSNQNDLEISTNEGGQEDSFLYLDNKMKFDYVNKDRLSKLTELDEKCNEILEYRSKIRMLENEIELLNLNFDETKEKNSFYENEVKKLTNLLENETQEKETKIISLNFKLEMLQNKLFNPRSSSINGNNSINSNSEDFMKNLSFLLFDLVKEFNEAVQKLLLKSKDENENLNKNLVEILSSRENVIKDSLNKFKEVFENEFVLKSNRTSQIDTSRNTSNEKMDWMKKQISELIPYKLKSLNLEESLYKCEKELKILSEKLYLVEIDKNTIKGLYKHHEETVMNLKKYATSIENKLSDTKDFILKNFPEKIEEFFLIYKI